jgi:hypothetical protein
MEEFARPEVKVQVAQFAAEANKLSPTESWLKIQAQVQAERQAELPPERPALPAPPVEPDHPAHPSSPFASTACIFARSLYTN